MTARLVTWGTAAILVPVVVMAVAIYADVAGSDLAPFDPRSDELMRRACMTSLGLGLTGVVLGTVAVVGRSGPARGVIGIVAGVLIALVSLVLLSMTETWESQPAPDVYGGWTKPAHATCALVRGEGGLFADGTIFVCVDALRRHTSCWFDATGGSGDWYRSSDVRCGPLARYARAHRDLPAVRPR